MFDKSISGDLLFEMLSLFIGMEKIAYRALPFLKSCLHLLWRGALQPGEVVVLTGGSSQNTGCGTAAPSSGARGARWCNWSWQEGGTVSNLKLQLFEKSVPEPLSPRIGKALVNPPVKVFDDTAPKYVTMIIPET